jgi:hypothetical protein
MDQADIPALLARLASDEDASRKMAVFKLQNSINDPSFADVFISSGGLVILRRLIMTSSGNTLAYSLQSLTRLLEVDMGWDIFEGPTSSELVERIVELIVTNPLVNILRGAMSILVSLVSHSQSHAGAGLTGAPGSFGFRALKPAVAVFPQFFNLVIQQLQSADHSLCANALMLINAILRDALSNDAVSINSATGDEEEWSKLVKRLQELGLIKHVYSLMKSSALQDLAHPMLEYQALTKVLVRKWRETPVALERQEHRRALKGIHSASAPDWGTTNGYGKDFNDETKLKDKKHNPEKWRRLGFETESPGRDFEYVGFLGMMDLTEYVRKNEDGFQKQLLEQASKPLEERLPIARASLAITTLLYEYFEVDKTDLDDVRGARAADLAGYDKLFQPLLLQWPRLHAAGLHCFFRIWRATAAKQGDFDKVAELVRILIEQVVGQAPRAMDVVEVEDELLEYDVTRLREVQMEQLDVSFEEIWGKHLIQVREELKQEALQFVREQRVRCLLEGSWFTKPVNTKDGTTLPWRFARLSHNRRHLHYADFERQTNQLPGLNKLSEVVDLGRISSVVSNVSAPNDDAKSTNTSGGSAINAPATGSNRASTTKITIYSYVSAAPAGGDGGKEQPILTLWPTSHSLASEWLDGLLMLLNQAPITAETNKLVNLVSEYGLKIRLLNVRKDAAFEGPPPGAGVVPSRDGLDEDYFFEV